MPKYVPCTALLHEGETRYNLSIQHSEKWLAASWYIQRTDYTALNTDIRGRRGVEGMQSQLLGGQAGGSPEPRGSRPAWEMDIDTS